MREAPQRKPTRECRHDINQLLLLNPFRDLAEACQERSNQLFLLLRHTLPRERAAGTLPQQSRRVGHDPHHLRRSPNAAREPRRQSIDRETGADGHHERRLLLPRAIPLSREIFTNPPGDLRLHGQDENVRFGRSFDVGAGGAHTERGFELLARAFEGVRDGDVLLRRATLGDEASDDGSAHIPAADEAEFAFFDPRGCHA